MSRFQDHKDCRVICNDRTGTMMYFYRDLAVLELEEDGSAFITAGKYRLEAYRRAINTAMKESKVGGYVSLHKIVGGVPQWKVLHHGVMRDFVDGMKL